MAILRRLGAAVAMLIGLGAAGVTAAAAQTAPQIPVVFVHGNGDTAALWQPTIWRFESQGYDPKLLFAVDLAAPLARSVDDKPQANRTSSTDVAAQLAAEVARVLITTGAQKVALVGNSRGANTIRNYVRFGGGAANTAIVVLGGGVNHGIFRDPNGANSEFNGAGALMARLNTGGEVVPGVAFTTIRSDKNDKYAQPTGEFIGRPGQPTGISYDAPALEGATNLVLDGVDHREVAFSPQAFALIYEAIAGKKPQDTAIKPEPAPVLTGIVSGFAAGGPTNLPLPGATVTIYQVDPATGSRRGEARHTRTVGADGVWGPFTADPAAYYEFEIAAPGYPTTHIYRTPFPRSANYVTLRLQPVDEKLKQAKAAVTITRPRGYFGIDRDKVEIAGSLPDGINKGVPGTATATRLIDQPGQSVPVRFNDETLTVRAESPADGHLAIAEFHY